MEVMDKAGQKLIKVDCKRRFAAFVLSLLAFLLRVVRCFARKPGRKEVIVFEPFAMGDVLSLEPLIRVLDRNQFKINICARNEWRDLIKPEYIAAWIESNAPWSSYNLIQKYDLRRYVGKDFKLFFRKLKSAAHGRIGLDTRGDIRSICLLYLAGCSKVYSLSHYLGSDLNVPSYAAEIVDAKEDQHRWQLNLQFARSLDIAVPEDEAGPSIRHLLNGMGAEKTAQVVLIPVATVSRKSWPADRWQALCKLISGHGLTPVGLCGPGQMEKARELLGDGIAVTECNSIKGWAVRLSSCEAVISVSTGPMHMANALGKPVVVVEGSGKLPLWGPCGANTRVVHHQDKVNCAPCYPHAAACIRDNECMKLILPDEVFQALLAVINTKNTAS